MDTTAFDIPGKARLLADSGALPRFEIATPLAEARIYLHGAHVAHFAPAGETALIFMSAKSHFLPGKAIRGGVPVIFPWFGPHPTNKTFPQHGFARARSWTPESVSELPGGEIAVVLRLEPDDDSCALWPEGGDWVLRHKITVGTALAMELEIENRGLAPIRCEEALHSYFSVSDVRNIEVRGLEGAEYIDKTDALRRKRQGMEPIRFTSETDRTYVNTASVCIIDDPGLRRRIVIERTGSQSAIVWNPWIEKAHGMVDFGDGEWPQMVCVETGNAADNTLEIAVGAAHVTKTTVRAEKI